MTKNLPAEEALKVFEQKDRTMGADMISHYKLVIEGMMNNLLPSKDLQHQNRYLY